LAEGSSPADSLISCWIALSSPDTIAFAGMIAVRLLRLRLTDEFGVDHTMSCQHPQISSFPISVDLTSTLSSGDRVC